MNIELSLHRSDEAHPKLPVIALTTSYASPVNRATTVGSVSMNGFMIYDIREFNVEQDAKRAEKRIKGRTCSSTW